MKNKHLITISLFATLMLANAAFAFAATPENGWWVNLSRSGTGFNIETQNNTVFVATFVYDEAGQPIWYSGSGQLDTNGTVTMGLFHSEGGPCIGCPYQAPTTTDVGIPLTLQFSSRGEGTVSWQGKEELIQRFNFKFGEGAERLLGKWTLVIGSSWIEQFILNKIAADGNALGIGYGYEPGLGLVGNTIDDPSKFKYYFIKRDNIDANLGFIFNFNGLDKIEGRVIRFSGEPTIKNLFSDATTRFPSILTSFEGFRSD